MSLTEGHAKMLPPSTLAAPDEPRKSPFSWLSHKCGVTQCAIGRGQVALENIARGETIVVYGGRAMTLDEYHHLPPEAKHLVWQVSESPYVLFGPMCVEEISNGDFFNHSCNPNAGLRGDLRLVAMRDIAVGEAITFDYAICMTGNIWDMECLCGELNCRRQVSGDDWMIPELQRKYAGYWMSFIQEKIDALSAPRSAPTNNT